MSLFSIFNTASTALDAQSVRLNFTASNLANADSVAGNQEDTFRARYPVFSSIVNSLEPESPARGVQVSGVEVSDKPLLSHYRPQHPAADEKGYVFGPNINVMDEMADMISASRSYQNNVEVMNTAKEMLMRTLNLGR
jgi:flagellar basal-body rod protein FlgC